MTSAMKGARHKARESALAYLYQTDVNIESVTHEPIQFVRHFSVEEDQRDFFLNIINGVVEHRLKIDPEIEASADNWKLYRLESIDRSILRMAIWELMFCSETDFQVVIDEAVELAKDFGSENSPSFVNGILDRLAKKLRPIQAYA